MLDGVGKREEIAQYVVETFHLFFMNNFSNLTIYRLNLLYSVKCNKNSVLETSCSYHFRTKLDCQCSQQSVIYSRKTLMFCPLLISAAFPFTEVFVSSFSTFDATCTSSRPTYCVFEIRKFPVRQPEPYKLKRLRADYMRQET